MGRSPEQAADDVAGLLDDDEGGIESVEARLDPKPAEQAEGQIVLRLMRPQERSGKREERVGPSTRTVRIVRGRRAGGRRRPAGRSR